ncbi:DUF3617 family protein [Phenylobacterium sp.]|uniref:DUF3617 domain-containing protein n=1 Tax=Phenylobacterium sp. TaxID=1871053 RepID=UPI0025E669FC|nr:DUF3617 family protein [Phenylobacterium sp.]
MRRAILICGVAALALAGCSKKDAGTPAAAGSGAEATAPAPASAPSPLAPPLRKAGLWTQTVTSAKATQSIKMCLDEAVQKKMQLWGQSMGKSDCQEHSFKPHPGGGWDFHSVCKLGESGTVTSDGSATGDFNSHYTVTLTSTTTGSPMPQANGEHKTVMEASWSGPCPADMKPGDMEMPGGFKINMSGDGPPKIGGAAGKAEK